MGRIFRYVALGDSTAVGTGAEHGGGYPERLFQRMRAQGWPVGILNLGENGAVSRDVLVGQVPKAVEVRPHLISVGVGSNDLWRMVSEDDYAANLTAIADALAATQAQVVICNLVDLGHAPVAKMAIDWLKVPVSAISARVHGFNRHLATLASRPRFTVIDLHALGEKELRERHDFFGADGFHPSGAGYQRWSELLWPSVEAAFRATKLEAQG